MTRRAALAGLGLLVAAALLAPYAVMLLTALKPEAEPGQGHATDHAGSSGPRATRR